MLTWLWQTLFKPFVLRLPMYIILFFVMKYFKINADFSWVAFSLFLSERACILFSVIFYNRTCVNLIDKIVNSSYFLYWITFKSYIESIFKGKLENKPRIETKVVWFTLKNIPLDSNDMYSIKLWQRINKIINEITLISVDISKPENKYNMALLKKHTEKLNEYMDLIDKWKKHTKNM